MSRSPWSRWRVCRRTWLTSTSVTVPGMMEVSISELIVDEIAEEDVCMLK